MKREYSLSISPNHFIEIVFGHRLMSLIALMLLVSSCDVEDDRPNPDLPVKYPSQVSGYTDRVSCFPGEQIQVFVHSSEAAENGAYRLYDISQKQVDEVRAALTIQSIKNPRPWENGLGYDRTYTYHDHRSQPSGFTSILTLQPNRGTNTE